MNLKMGTDKWRGKELSTGKIRKVIAAAPALGKTRAAATTGV
jgi:hypothetical protein